MNRLASAGAALCLLLTGCGSDAEPRAEHRSTPTVSSSAAPPTPEIVAVGNPTEIDIPAIDAHSSLVPLGLDENNQHEVPPVSQPEQAGWYEPGPEPGQIGPAIVLGHVNGGGRPGVFAHLADLQPGDEIDVDALRFVVTEVQHADKDAFPADRVYGATEQPELRVITCGGVFNHASGNYEDNIIVYAEMV